MTTAPTRTRSELDGSPTTPRYIGRPIRRLRSRVRPTPSLLRRELRPAAGGHVAEDVAHPGELFVLSEMLGHFVIDAAGVAERGVECHLLGAGGVGDLILHGAGGGEGWLPCAHAARGQFDVAA